MATNSKGYTPPKGRATATRDEPVERSSRIPPLLEWIVLGIVVASVIAAAWVFTSGSDGTPHNGAPRALTTAEVVTSEASLT